MFGGKRDSKLGRSVFSFWGIDNIDTALVEIYGLLFLGTENAENGRDFYSRSLGVKLYIDMGFVTR